MGSHYIVPVIFHSSSNCGQNCMITAPGCLPRVSRHYQCLMMLTRQREQSASSGHVNTDRSRWRTVIHARRSRICKKYCAGLASTGASTFSAPETICEARSARLYQNSCGDRRAENSPGRQNDSTRFELLLIQTWASFSASLG